MSVLTADRVKETTTTTGTGAVTLAGAVSGFRTWASVFGSGTTAGISYCIHLAGGTEWEVGKGSYNGTTGVLTRTTVEASSNSNALVAFSAGTKNVFTTFSAVDAAASGGIITTSTTTNLSGILKGDGANVGAIALPADATKYLDGTGAFSTPSGGGGGSSSLPIDAGIVVGSGDLFAGTSLDAGWSDLQSTAVTSKDRSVDGYLILKNSGATSQRRGIKRSFSPAGDFTVITKIMFLSSGYNTPYGGLFIGASTPSDAAGGNRLGFNLTTGSTSGTQLYIYKMASGVETAVTNPSLTGLGEASQFEGVYFPVWFRIKRVGSTVSFGISWDGVQFVDLATTTTISFTVATIGLELGQNSDTRANRAVFDYIATTG